MKEGISIIVYSVKDMAQATALYSKIFGTEPYFTGAYYVGFKVGDQEVGLVPSGQNQGTSVPIAYLEVDDIRQNLQSLLDAGAQLHKDVADVGGGLLVATITDGSGNIIGLRQQP